MPCSGEEVCIVQERFFMPLQIEPGYNPHSVQGRVCCGFSSRTDLGFIREDRSGAFCERDRKCDYHDGTSFSAVSHGLQIAGFSSARSCRSL